MAKRSRSCSGSHSPIKKSRLELPLSIANVASPEAAAAADADPPLRKLLRALEKENVIIVPPKSGDAGVYWMRMEDMRSSRFSPHLTPFIISLIYLSLRQPSTRTGFCTGAQRPRPATRLFCLESRRLCRPRQESSSDRFYPP